MLLFVPSLHASLRYPVVPNKGIKRTCAFEMRKSTERETGGTLLSDPHPISWSFRMTPYQKRLTPLLERLAGDMKIRNLAQATIDSYTYHVGKFSGFVKKNLSAK